MKSIDQLIENGFTVQKTKQITTIVEHSKPFVVERDGKHVSSILNKETNKYTITFAGLCSNGLVPNDISFDNSSLLKSINESVNQMIARRSKSRTLPAVRFLPTTFKQVAINEQFYKNVQNDSSQEIAYKKISETTASKVQGIASVLEVFLDENDSVYTDYSDEFSNLTQDQKWDLVFAYDENTPLEMLRSNFVDDLDYIPGVENLSDNEKSKIVDELVMMWHQHNDKLLNLPS